MLLSNLVEVLRLLNFKHISLNYQQRIDEIFVFLFAGLSNLKPLMKSGFTEKMKRIRNKQLPCSSIYSVSIISF